MEDLKKGLNAKKQAVANNDDPKKVDYDCGIIEGLSMAIEQIEYVQEIMLENQAGQMKIAEQEERELG